MNRCAWVPEGDEVYRNYHDEEWGVPVHDDRLLFEFLILEGAQAGLSWRTILGRRENYRSAYDGFDPGKVAAYGEDKIASLLADPGIIRNRLKVRASVLNARIFTGIQAEFGSFDAYIWNWTDGAPLVHHYDDSSRVPATSELSDRISADLKKRGMKFVGSTIIYSFLQACGMVMDHSRDCFRYGELAGSVD